MSQRLPCRRCKARPRAAFHELCWPCRTGRPPCRHCDLNSSAEGKRGLCGPCHRDIAVRGQYAPFRMTMSKGGGGWLCVACKGPPAKATKALPGTAEKVKVMARRAKRRLGLFHPEDGRR
jgi:hypothetical protein